jgi:Na+/melibiose symporter-like transporter
LSLPDLCEKWGYRAVFVLVQLWAAAVILGFYFVPRGGTSLALALFGLLGVPWAGAFQIAWCIVSIGMGERSDAGVISFIVRAVGEILPCLIMAILALVPVLPRLTAPACYG